MRPVEAKFEDTELFVLESAESQRVLWWSPGAPLTEEAEETGTQFASVATEKGNSGVAL